MVQRGHNRDPIFFEDGDYRAYLHCLAEGAVRWDVAVHSYVLMTNHVHILATPSDREGVGKLMQHLGRRYVPFINASYGSSGSLFEGRYKASLIDSDRYLLTCMRYIELNPVRAGMTKGPGQYRWSSYKANALGHEDAVLEPHPLYLALGRTRSAREKAYKALFETHLDENERNAIHAAWQSGTPLGNDVFRAKIEQWLEMKVGQTSRGRPRKAKSAL